jgi:branched-chain amino acid transport system ATP-binding protein
MAEPVLSLQGLGKRFGAVTVADQVSLDVPSGTIHAVIGPNGAGKTSLINLVSGLIRADTGAVLLDGHDITALSLRQRARRGLLRSFQITAILPEFTALENVALAAQSPAWGFVRPAARDAALNRAAMAELERCGLAARAHHPAGALSHGEKRPLVIATALAGRPRVLLLDEPLAGAGPEETARLIGLLRGLREDCAIVLVEHDMAAVFALADTISVLVYGRLIATGPPGAIRADATVRAAYLGEDA